MKNHFLKVFLILTITIFFSCNKYEILYKEPYIKTRFLDVSTINTINTSLTQLDTLLKKFTIGSETKISLKAPIDTFFYKAQKFYTLKSIPLETFISSQNTFFNLISYERTLYTSSENISLLKNIKTKINTFVSKLKNFNTPVSEIGNNQQSILYKDTLNTYNIPLNINDTVSFFYMKQKEKKIYFTLTYSVEQHITETNFIEIQAKNVKIKNHSFDSAKIIYNNTHFLSDETTLYFYF